MALARELYVNSKGLDTARINVALHHRDVADIAQLIRSSDNFVDFYLSEPPENEELGRRVSDAIVYNTYIKRIVFDDQRAAIRDLVAWIASRDTLINMTSLQRVSIHVGRDMSKLDGDALFPLLLTNTSLHSFGIYFHEGNMLSIDDGMSTLAGYLGAASLREFEFHSGRLSGAGFTSLCDGVASSTLQKFALSSLFKEFNLETAAESLARMIVESSLEEVRIQRPLRWGIVNFSLEEGRIWSERFVSALQRTAPLQNLDFAFTQIGNYDPTHLRINRKWKPFVSANTPLALWPHILKKAHASPETSHGSAGILFYLLRERPDLVPAP